MSTDLAERGGRLEIVPSSRPPEADRRALLLFGGYFGYHLIAGLLWSASSTMTKRR